MSKNEQEMQEQNLIVAIEENVVIFIFYLF